MAKDIAFMTQSELKVELKQARNVIDFIMTTFPASAELLKVTEEFKKYREGVVGQGNAIADLKAAKAHVEEELATARKNSLYWKDRYDAVCETNTGLTQRLMEYEQFRAALQKLLYIPIREQTG
jgi:hypothetical protein